MTRLRLLAAPFAPVAALLLAACAAQSGAKAPSAPSADAAPARVNAPQEEALNDLEGQIAALGAAEAQLDRAIRRQPGAASGAVPMKKAENLDRERESPRAPVTPPRAGAAEMQRAYGASADDGTADPCATACSALSSMERSAKHLCDLTGDGDARCDNARSRVAGATERVNASCPACGEAR